MAKPTKLPEWATVAADVVEPTLGQKQLGWVTGTKPPNGWFNWWMELVFDWMFWLESKFDEGVSGDRIGCHGIDSTGVGVSQTGVSGTGGTAGGVGVHGTGDGIGEGVLGVGGTTGAGVRGFHTAYYGLVAQGDGSAPAYAAFRLIVQDADPTTPEDGAIWINSTSGLMKVRIGGVTKTFTLS